MLNVVYSNRLELLADRLSGILQQSDPLQPETVIVPNQGLARWLWLQLAAQHGVSANLDFTLPGSFVWRVYHRLLPAVPESSPYDPGVMAWRLHRLLHEAADDNALQEIRHWCRADDRQRFELAERLARQFDQYLVFRPDWIEQWRCGEGSGWQPELWRRLAAETEQPDWMELRRRLEALPPGQIRGEMPKRVTMFGISLLSPAYLDVLQLLAKHIEVNVLLPNPCREHWAHIVPARDFGRLAGVADEKLQYLESGNALLASWGGQGRDLPDQIEELGSAVILEDFSDPGDATVLRAVQSQILNLVDPGANETATVAMTPGDRSIQVHVCHSITRELEVLHDQLLALFDADTGLSASDILVMTPDIDAYAPLIDAVFATAGRIPFSVTDQRRRKAVLIDTFLGLFDLPQERFDANAVLAVLETPPVRRRFGLSETDLGQVHDWVRDVGVRWGLDAAQRSGFGRSDGRHSWRHGLDRLLLGVALPGESTGTFAGILPSDAAAGSDAGALGSVAEYLERLRRMHVQMATQRSVADWSQWLQQQFEQFIDVGEEQEQEAQLLRNAIAVLSQHAQVAGHSGLIDFEVALDWVLRELDSATSGRGYLGHGVTFAGLVPMRTVPFRVICLLGMNDNAFPRIERPPGFDLIARSPRRGDRSRRDDDRQAFLECLLNAREVFYISYVGRSVRDDTPLPPSVLVSELLDYCDRSFAHPDGVDAARAITTTHRVQPFSPRYFDESAAEFFSYADILPASGRVEVEPFMQRPLASPEEAVSITLPALLGFFHNPTKALLKQRMRISYDGEADPIATDDAISLDPLAAWSLGDRYLRLARAGVEPQRIGEILQELAPAPSGPAGRLVMQKLLEQGERLEQALVEFLPPGAPAVHDFTRDFAGIRLGGRLEGLYPDGLFAWRYGRTRGRDCLALWLRHLILNVERPGGVASVSHWRANDMSLRFAPVAEPRELLHTLLQLYQRGMSEAVPFFPESGWEYAVARETKDAESALAEARKKFEGDYHKRTENTDPYRHRVFAGGVDWALFAELAELVYRPLRDHLEEQQ
ncbi:MAG: exodeoxyribonuclease V subunit gamma [Gammaproteobacteria bacterium]|nr:exodeoxyribonuclease V subunit gamma [Gammaproteobacteria bacterium]NNF62094.1 exodeoxyribonuclease V subunit gamma [Gammaproteobacteria bacterium]NNM20478.1 exodeoxyribonuclease V subunit gamma [Gammaproteobacteria bacterium]